MHVIPTMDHDASLRKGGGVSGRKRLKTTKYLLCNACPAKWHLRRAAQCTSTAAQKYASDRYSFPSSHSVIFSALFIVAPLNIFGGVALL